MNPKSQGWKRPWLWLLVPLLASAWTREWWAPDEPRYAQVAREVYESGQFLVMHLCGEVYDNKPPLMFWISGWFGWIAHWNEFAMRLPVVLATAVSAWLTGRFALRYWGEREARLAPVIYLSTAMVLWYGARLQIDPLLGSLCSGALYLASEPAPDLRRRARLALGAGLLTGLAVLAKGPVAFLLVGIPLAAWRWIGGTREPRLSRAAVLAAVAAAILPGLAWALAVVAREPEHAYALFLGQFFERALVGRNHISPFWTHLVLQPALILPWTLPVLAGSWLSARALLQRWRGEPFDEGLARAGAWWWLLLLAFSLSPEKRDLYLLPAYPAVALLGARWLALALESSVASRFVAPAAPVLLGSVGIALCCARLGQHRLPSNFPPLTWQPFAIGLPLAVGALAALRSARRSRSERPVHALAASLAATATIAAVIVYPLVNPWKSDRSLALYLTSCVERPKEIPCVGVMPEGYRYYSGLPIVPGPKPDPAVPDPLEQAQSQILEFTRREGPDFLALIKRDSWMSWSEATRAAYEIRHEQVVAGRRVLVLGAKAEQPR